MGAENGGGKIGREEAEEDIGERMVVVGSE